MNLVETIQTQLDEDTVQILSTKIGAGTDQTRAAIQGAVPALLVGLTQVSKQPAGAQALATAVDKVDTGITENLGDTIKSGLGGVAQQGSSLLAQVMASSGLLSGISRSVSSYSGLSQGSTSSLMGVMGPLVLGNLKRHLAGDISPSGISNLLASQQEHIASAMPADLSDKLAEVGGLDVGSLLGAAGLGAAGLGAAGATGLGGQTDSSPDPVPSAAPPSQDGGSDSLAGLGATSSIDQGFETPTLDGNDPPPAPMDGLENDVKATNTSASAAQSGDSDIWRTVLMAIIAILVVWLIINLIR